MVYVFLANGFEEVEALTPVDILRRLKVDVKTVGIGGKAVCGSHGICVNADITEEEALKLTKSEKTEMIIMPGGMPGASNLDSSDTVDKFINIALENDAYLAAICAAPMIYGKRGLLKNHDATCYPGFEKYLEGANVYEASVVVDGNFITSNGMGGALDFALQLGELLKGEIESNKIAESIMA